MARTARSLGWREALRVRTRREPVGTRAAAAARLLIRAPPPPPAAAAVEVAEERAAVGDGKSTRR